MRSRHPAITMSSTGAITFAASLGIALLCAAPARAGEITPMPGPVSQYEVTEIPHLPDYPVPRTWGVNNHGHVVGGNWTCPFILSCLGRAFFFDGETVHDYTAPLLASLPPDQIGITLGVDINDNIDVLTRLTIVDVGVFFWLWRDAEDFVQIAGPTGAGATTAWALNESGTVVGNYTKPDGTSRAFLWTADTGITHEIEPPARYDSTSGRGLNEAGDVVGTLTGAAGQHGYAWSRGTITVLPPLPGDVRSQAIDINEPGLVVGISTDSDFDDSLVVWQDGAIVGSATFAADDVLLEIYEINDAGVVIGSYWPVHESPQQLAFRWSPAGGFVLLNDMELSSNVNLWEGTGVNESGQIALWGEYPGFIGGAFLLTPAGIPGDVTGDGAVNVDDLVQVITSWGPCPGCAADLDGDGDVDVDDLVAVIVNWS